MRDHAVFFLLFLLHATTSPKQEDMSLHCTMCHRSCETGSSFSFALTVCKKKKNYLRSHKRLVFIWREMVQKILLPPNRAASSFSRKGSECWLSVSSCYVRSDVGHEELAASDRQPSAELVLRYVTTFLKMFLILTPKLLFYIDLMKDRYKWYLKSKEWKKLYWHLLVTKNCSTLAVTRTFITHESCAEIVNYSAQGYPTIQAVQLTRIFAIRYMGIKLQQKFRRKRKNSAFFTGFCKIKLDYIKTYH